jgi:hypothetical protein
MSTTTETTTTVQAPQPSPDGLEWGSGPVADWDPPHRLVHEWRSSYDPEMAGSMMVLSGLKTLLETGKPLGS